MKEQAGEVIKVRGKVQGGAQKELHFALPRGEGGQTRCTGKMMTLTRDGPHSLTPGCSLLSSMMHPEKTTHHGKVEDLQESRECMDAEMGAPGSLSGEKGESNHLRKSTGKSTRPLGRRRR